MASQKENQKAATSARVIRPSPNEEEAILKNAIAERRRQRLLQVRKQEKKLSGRILTAVRNRREKEMKILKMQLKDEWEKRISAELGELEEEYRNRIKTLGEGHRSVLELPETDASISQQEMTERALQRYKDALKKLIVQRAALKKIEEEKMKLRHRVAHEEQIRAAQIALKPHREPDFILKTQNQNRCSTLSSRSKTIDTFSTTRYHMTTVFAEKAEQLPEIDAREAAKDLEEKIAEARELLEKDLNERNEKAHLRHHHARKQVLLDQSKDRLIVQLEELEYRDRVRRQQVLAKIPKQVFQPPYQRVADAKAKQIILEEAFEGAHRTDRDSREKDLYLDLDSDLNLAEPDINEKGDAWRDLPQHMHDVEPPSLEADTREIAVEKDAAPERENAFAQGEPAQDLAKGDPVGQPNRMQKLLGRIRKQQDEWSERNSRRKLIESEARVDEAHPSPVQTEGQCEIEPVAVIVDESTDSLLSADIERNRLIVLATLAAVNNLRSEL